MFGRNDRETPCTLSGAGGSNSNSSKNGDCVSKRRGERDHELVCKTKCWSGGNGESARVHD